MTLGALGVGIVFASFAASVGALYLLQYLYKQRHNPGADWFMGNMASVALFCFSYGLALLVFEPTLRTALGAVAFLCVCFMGPFFLAFGLEYTGRGDLIYTPLFGVVAVVPMLTVALVVTNPAHGFVWTDAEPDPVFGLATISYTVQPWGMFALLFSIGTAAIGSLLLIGAVLSYGPLYRREAIAVTLSTVPPSVGVSLWLFGIGPVPQLHLTAPLMLIHVTLDAYAFVGTHMFETNPATQRMAERTGLDSLSDPVFILDTEDQIVRTNDSADAVFSEQLPETHPIPLEAALGVSLGTLREIGEYTTGTNSGETYAVSYSPLTDPSGGSVGSMVVLYNVTEQRQREQQLGVLNRVLRHNLRNETTVISGYAEGLEAEIDDPTLAEQAAIIAAASDRLHGIAQKAQSFQKVQEQIIQPDSVDVAKLSEQIVQQYIAEHEDARIKLDVEPPDLHCQTDPVVLSMLLENLIENAIVHSDVPEPTVSVAASEAPPPDSSVRFEIRDTNDRIPDQEIETLRAGKETSLQHGQGIGLWIVYWCVKKLRGEITFEYEDGNILVVTLPVATKLDRATGEPVD